MLIRRAEVDGRGPLDVRIEGERIAAVAQGLSARCGEIVLDAEGGALLPGLHDHHIHLLALAAARRSVVCGPPQVRSAGALRAVLASARPGRGWLRGVGYHESVAGDLDRRRLDAAVSDRPLRIQHRSGAAWLLNSPAVAALGLDAGVDAPGVERDERGRATGRLFDLDAWLRERLADADPPPLAPVGRELARLGVTGVTDASPENGPAELALLEAAATRGDLPQRLHLMGSAALPQPTHPRVTRGALKLMLHERALPAFDVLEDRVRAAHGVGRGAALHCVTRAEVLLAAAVIEAAGARPGDRLEHASVAPPEAVERIAKLATVAVVTQPGFLRDRGDAYLEEVEAEDQPWLYRTRAFLDAGVPLAAGSDAPFGHPDPWRSMRAATSRSSASGRVLGPDERLTPDAALALFASPAEAPGAPPRRVASGCVADLCLLDRPWKDAAGGLSRGCVTATWVGGRLAWHRDA